MSTTIDSRVVEMRFDNRHFEENVSTTMSTLDKFKQKLHLDGATKGLENVNSAAKNVNLSGLGNAVDTVQMKFSAMQVMGVTALANITNSAVNAGKRIVSALTIDPVKTGFQEYETQINAVQTILANTQSKGTTLDDVNSALDTLNTYADKTIYNFTEMTKNIGTFTAAGVDLDTSVNAIQGIANLAAISGSTSQQASTAMYQLSQALASGTVKLMDWNSVVNAGMGGQVFQDALKETARVHGVAIDDMIESEGSFRETLKGEWLTAEILTETLQKFTLTTEGLTEEQIAANREMLKAKGYTDEQIDAIFKLGKTSTDAATKVKTFTQLFDTLKESAQSGWTQTWELIFGDFEEAKAFFTGLSEKFGAIINAISDARNKLLGGALSSKWDEFSTKINKAGISTEEFQEKLSETFKEHGKSLDDVIKEYGSLSDAVAHGAISSDMFIETLKKFTGASEDSSEALKKENEYIVKKGDNLTKIARKYGMTWRELYKLNSDIINDPNLIYPDQVLKLSDAQLKSMGYTEKQVDALKELAAEADKTGEPLNELIMSLEKPSGRVLLLESFTNIIDSVIDSCKAMGKAWKEIFPPMSSEQLYNIIAAFHSFTEKLKISEETSDKLTRTFKGLFAIIDIILTVVGGPIKIVFKIVSQLLGVLGYDILDVTASIGDVLVEFRDWIDTTLDFTKVFEKLLPYLSKVGGFIKKLIHGVQDLDIFENVVGIITKVSKSFREWIVGLKDAENIPLYIIQGIVGGLTSGVKAVWNAALAIGKSILDSIKGFLGIHSPSTETKEVGTNVIEGLALGIKGGASKIWEALKGAVTTVVDFLKNVDYGAIFAGVLATGITVTIYKIGSAILNLTAPLEGLGDLFEDVGDAVKRMSKGVTKLFKAGALKLQADALLSFAIAIAVLAASVFVLSKLEVGAMWKAVGVIAALAGIVALLSITIGKLGAKESLEVGKFAVALLGISISLLILASALKKVSSLSRGELAVGGAALAGLALFILGLVAICKLSDGSIDKVGSTLIKLSVALILLVFVIKQISKLEPGALFKGVVTIAAFGGIVAGLMAATQLVGGSKNVDKIGSMILKISAAMLLMVLVIKLISKMKPAAIAKGILVITLFSGIIVALLAATKLMTGSKNVNKIGGMLMGIGVALLLMALTMQIVSGMGPEKLKTGIIAIVAFSGVIVALIASTKLAGKAKGIASTLLAVSIAIGILAVIATLLGFVSVKHMAKGIVAVGLLAGLIAMLIVATRGAKDCKKNLIVMSVAIGILAVAMVALSALDPAKLATAALALTAVMGTFALMIAATKLAKNSKAMTKTLILMLGVVAALAGIIIALSYIDSSSALANTAALSLLMLVFSGSMVILGHAGNISKSVSKNILPMLGVMAALALILGVMAALDVTASLQTTLALSILILAFSSAMVILGHVGSISKSVSKNILPMLGVVAALAIILGVMSALNVTGSIQTALALSVLLNAMAVAMVILQLVGSSSMTGIGALALMGLVVAELAVILGLMSYFNVEPSISTAVALSTLLMSMSAALILLSVVGLLGPAAFIGIAALAVLIAGIGGLIAGIGYLVTEIPMLETFLDKGIDILGKIGYGLGSFFGNIVAGFGEAVLSLLPVLGESLSKFMTNAQPFIEGCKTIDASVLAGVGILTAAVIALSVADVINAITTFLSGGSSFADLGTQLSEFMTNAKPFIENAKLIDPAVVESVKALAETILILTAADLLEGLTSWITGGSSIADFGGELVVLGESLSAFSASLGEFTPAQVVTISCAAAAIKTMAEAAKTIPNEGGLWGAIVGENGLATFSGYLPQLGLDLSSFVTNLGTWNEAQVATVQCAADAIKAMAEAAKTIPNEGGLWGAIVGENSLATFSGYLPQLGTDLSSFVTNLGAWNSDQVATVQCAADAIKAMAEVAKEIPNEGGLWGAIVGDNSLAKFGSYLPGLGMQLKMFVTNLGTWSSDQVATVQCAADAIKAMAEVAKTIPNEGGLWGAIVGENSLADFGAEMESVGSNLKNFVTNLGTWDESKVMTVNAAVRAIKALGTLADSDLKGAKANMEGFADTLPSLASNLIVFISAMTKVSVESVNAAVHNVEKLTKMLTTVDGVKTTSTTSFKEALNDIGESGVTSFVAAFTCSTAVDTVKKAASFMINNAIAGAKSKSKSLQDEYTKIAIAGADAMGTDEVYFEYMNTGAYLVEGFAAGITENAFAAKAAAVAMAKAALKAAEEALGVASPSKEFYKIGDFAGQGFTNALTDFTSMSYNAGAEMAGAAKNGLGDAISKIADVVNNDIDAQPTIRPVLDLSNVRTGVGAISDMFSQGMAIGATADIGAINTMMNQRIQNGDNDDVVSAIDKLCAKLDNNSGDTYNINGISYDDSSNIGEALQTIVRAARIGGRN